MKKDLMDYLEKKDLDEKQNYQKKQFEELKQNIIKKTINKRQRSKTRNNQRIWHYLQ